jgi:hypothetical protein
MKNKDIGPKKYFFLIPRNIGAHYIGIGIV